jgi:hypothetical protein
VTGTYLDLVGFGLNGEGRGGGDGGRVGLGAEMVDFEGGDDEGSDLVAGDAARERDIDGFPQEGDPDETGADAARLKMQVERRIVSKRNDNRVRDGDDGMERAHEGNPSCDLGEVAKGSPKIGEINDAWEGSKPSQVSYIVDDDRDREVN